MKKQNAYKKAVSGTAAAPPSLAPVALASPAVDAPAPSDAPNRFVAMDGAEQRSLADDLPRTLARRWMLIVAIAAVFGLAAWLMAALQPKRYRATSMAAVTPIAADLSPADLMRGVDTLERRVVISSVAALAAAPVTKRQTGAAEDYTITALVMPNTNLFRIEVEGPDPRRAASIANRIPGIVAVQTHAIFKIYGVTLVSEAATPASPALPRPGRALATGLALGALLGSVAAWFLDRRSLAGAR